MKKTLFVLFSAITIFTYSNLQLTKNIMVNQSSVNKVNYSGKKKGSDDYTHTIEDFIQTTYEIMNEFHDQNKDLVLGSPEFYVKFNDYIEQKALIYETKKARVRRSYSSGKDHFETFWWGFKLYVSSNSFMNSVKSIGVKIPPGTLPVGTAIKALWGWLAAFAAPALVAIKATLGAAAVLISQIAGCLIGRQIWNKKGVVIRMLWIGVLTGCWDQ